MARSMARGTILSVAGQAWHLLTAFLVYALLARALGPAEFGRWRLVLSVLNWFELFVNSGLVKVVTKAIAESPQERPRLVRTGYVGQGALALGLLAMSLLAAGPIASALGDPSLAWLLRLSMLDIPLYAAFMIAASILLGVQRFERHAFGMSLYATAKFVLVGGAVLAGFGVPGALAGNALASIVGFAVAFTRWPASEGAWRRAAAEAPATGRAAVPYLGQNLTEGLVASADLWFVQRFAGAAAVVGLYGSAATLAEVPLFLFIGLNRAIFPSIARVEAEGDTCMSARYARQGVRLGLLVTILGVAVVAATGRQALTFVFSAAYAGAYIPLVILFVAACGKTVWSTCTEILMARDRRRAALGILAAAAAGEIVLLAILTGAFGEVGAAAAVAVAALGAAAAVALAVREVLTWRMLLTVLRALAAAAVVGATLYLLSPSAPLLLAAYPLAGVVYGGLLYLTGEFDSDDIASIREALGRKGTDRVS